MNELKDLSLKSNNPVYASKEQNAYLSSGNYSIPFSGGKIFRRHRHIIAHNPKSGKILVKEQTCCDDYNYYKTFVISREGRPEKYRGDNF